MANDVLRWSVVALATVGGTVTALAVLQRVLARLTRRSPVIQDLIALTRRPARLLAAAIAAQVVVYGSPFSEGVEGSLRHGLAIVVIGAFAWLVVRAGYALTDAALRRYEVAAEDNLHARKVHTQVQVLRRVMVVAVGVLAVAAMLTTFSEARALGTSILASAGVVGLVAGVAAQSTIGNLIAGIQIALTEPIRLDDVVVVEGEWGRIEEITLTYVVVRIWDQRRLVLPVSYFVHTPFQNWTRMSAELLAPVYVYADYTVPVDEVRDELHRILAASPHWDGNVEVLQVTNSDDRGVELRALMSAKDSPTAWNLRCEVREKLIAFLQRRYPDALPRTRAELAPLAGDR